MTRPLPHPLHGHHRRAAGHSVGCREAARRLLGTLGLAALAVAASGIWPY